MRRKDRASSRWSKPGRSYAGPFPQMFLALLLLAHFGKEGKPETVIPKIN
jgi:hypothetical protein